MKTKWQRWLSVPIVGLCAMSLSMCSSDISGGDGSSDTQNLAEGLLMAEGESSIERISEEEALELAQSRGWTMHYCPEEIRATTQPVYAQNPVPPGQIGAFFHDRYVVDRSVVCAPEEWGCMWATSGYYILSCSSDDAWNTYQPNTPLEPAIFIVLNRRNEGLCYHVPEAHAAVCQ